MKIESEELVHPKVGQTALPALNSREGRVEIVNEIIENIASRGRKFFAGQFGVAKIFQKNGLLYLKNEYNGKDMCLHTKFGYQPKGWHHGGTLWGLTKDFKNFIITGEKINGQNGYGGLYCPHWGYSESDMKMIQDKAKELGYL